MADNNRPRETLNHAQAKPLRLLESELRAKAARIRNVQVPQKVGMAAAAQLAADRLPKHLTALVQAQVSDGRLTKQWEELRKRTESDKETGETVVVATLLVSQAMLAREWLASMAGNNEADAHRFAEQATALEMEADSLAARVALIREPTVEQGRNEEGDNDVD